MIKIKVGIDIGPLNNGHQSRGIGFYVRNLLYELKKIDFIEVIEGNRSEDFTAADLIHYPVFDLFRHTLPIWKTKPSVVTIHDVIPLVFVRAYPVGIMGKVNLELQKFSLRSVKAIITDSVSAQKDIVRFLKVKKTLVDSIYLAPGGEFKKISDKAILNALREKYDLPDRFIVYVGNVNWNKNLIRMAEAAINLNVCMVCIGKGFEDVHPQNHIELNSYREFLQKYGNHPMIKRIGYVDEVDLVGIINLSDICLFASLYEGFGLPILQAQACEVPVITSNVSSMPEVAGEGAILVDPRSVDQISKALDRVLNDYTLKSELIKKGNENLKRFSWLKTAKQTAAVYMKVLGKNYP